jgi:hypothetical protein
MLPIIDFLEINMNIALAGVLLILALFPAHYMALRNVTGGTIILSGMMPRNWAAIYGLTIGLFALVAALFRGVIARYWQLVPVIILMMCGYLFFFSDHVYDDIVEYRTFSNVNQFGTKNVVITGAILEHSKSGPNYYATLYIPELRELSPTVPIRVRLYNVILRHSGKIDNSLRNGKTGCFLKMQLEQAGSAKRLVYRGAYDVDDTRGC